MKLIISFTEHLRTISEQSLRWRRDKVRELTIKGYTQREISKELQIALAQVNKDLKYMRQEAKHNIEHYIDEYLPAEFQHYLDALNMIVKEMWDLKTEDNRELMQSRTLIKDCCEMRIDLLSNATVVDRAVKIVDRHKDLISPPSDSGMDNGDRGLMPQNKGVRIDDTKSISNEGEGIVC